MVVPVPSDAAGSRQLLQVKAGEELLPAFLLQD